MAFSHVVLVGIDGLGGWYLQRLGDALPATMPHLCGMLRQCGGPAHAHAALDGRTVFPAVSGPAWASILSGTQVHEHGISGNDWPAQPGAPGAPGALGAPGTLEALGPPLPPCDVQPFFAKRLSAANRGVGGRRPLTVVDLLAAAGRTSHVAVSWSWLTRLFDDAAAVVVVDGADDDERCTAATCDALAKHNFSFVHLDAVDHAGHEHGWGSPQYYAAAAGADAMLGRILRAAEAAAAAVGRPALVVVCSDHGGSGATHGAMLQPDMQVPLAVWATAATTAAAAAAAAAAERPLSVIDVAPTILRALDVPVPNWMGGVPRVPVLAEVAGSGGSEEWPAEAIAVPMAPG